MLNYLTLVGITYAEHILLGWEVIRHKEKKKPQSGVYHADMTARALVWTSIQDTTNIDNNHDSSESFHKHTGFNFHLGFATIDAYRERKRKILFSEIVSMSKGPLRTPGVHVPPEVLQAASRVLAVTHSTPQSESIVKTFYLEFCSDYSRDHFLEGMECLLLCKI